MAKINIFFTISNITSQVNLVKMDSVIMWLQILFIVPQFFFTSGDSNITNILHANIFSNTSQARGKSVHRTKRNASVCSTPTSYCPDSGISIRTSSICSWHYQAQRDITRVPDVWYEAVCDCSTPYLFDNLSVSCVKVFSNKIVRILANVQNRTDYKWTTQRVSVGCTAVLKCANPVICSS